MSVSAPAHQRASVRRRPLSHILLAMLGALALVGVLVAIAVSINSSASAGTHVIRSTSHSTAAESTPGPGHK